MNRDFMLTLLCRLETKKETAATNSTGSPDVVCVNNMDKIG